MTCLRGQIFAAVYQLCNTLLTQVSFSFTVVCFGNYNRKKTNFQLNYNVYNENIGIYNYGQGCTRGRGR